MAPLAGDHVSALLQRIGVTTWVAGRSRASGSWTLEPPAQTGGFHAVLSGTMVLVDHDDHVHRLAAGDVAIITNCRRHYIGDAPDSPRVDLRLVVTKERIRRHDGIQIGDGPPDVEFIGGFIAFEGPCAPALGSALPPVIVMRSSAEPAHSLVRSVVRLLDAQAGDPAPGTNVLMTHLVTLLFLEAARRTLVNHPRSGDGWVRAVLDEHIGPALGLMHASPGREWSLQQMADEAGLSRTTFHERFTSLVGVAPATYLREHRLEVAAGLLRRGSASVAEIARRVGYASPGAFCSAFKRWSGRSPGEYRDLPAA